MIRRARTALLCAAVAATVGAGGASAHTAALTADEVPALVVQARQGDAAATARLAAWLGAARAGDPAAVAVAGEVVEAGVVRAADRVRSVDGQARASGWDARTGLLDAIVAGTSHLSMAQAAGLVARTAGMTAADAAGQLSAPFDADVSPYVVQASFADPQLDPEDLVNDELLADSEYNIASTNPSKTVCRAVDYYEPLLNFTLMGLEVCATWKYDGSRYVGSGSRTINPYITSFGTARGWHWVGTSSAVHNYYNYKRKGAKSGYHTRTVGHFQRCPAQTGPCDQEKLPTITIDGHYDGTYSQAAAG
jgi:hypothetical protein